MVAGLRIGIVAALMGIASGELRIPMIVLLCGVDIEVAATSASIRRSVWSRLPPS